MIGLATQAPPVLGSDLPPFLDNMQNATYKFLSNSNLGNVSSNFLLYLPIPDPNLEDGLKYNLSNVLMKDWDVHQSQTYYLSQNR